MDREQVERECFALIGKIIKETEDDSQSFMLLVMLQAITSDAVKNSQNLLGIGDDMVKTMLDCFDYSMQELNKRLDTLR